MIDMGIVLGVERNAAPVIETHRHPPGRYPLDRGERAVLDPHATFVAKEHDTVAGRELTHAAVGLYRHVVAKVAASAQPVPRFPIEALHLGVGVGKNAPALARLGLARAIGFVA